MARTQPEPRKAPIFCRAVKAHILDLYAYLNGRANGSVKPGRPPQTK